MSRKKYALSPSVAETLSAGFTYFGSLPLAARGVEVLSQSCRDIIIRNIAGKCRLVMCYMLVEKVKFK